ncbi:MAG: low temperature requirement protein A [Geminicoccaceae bacterium]
MAREDHPMWRRPRHHLDAEHASDHVHWIELFYDLIHVVTIFLLGNYLSHHGDFGGFLVFTALFISIWYAWADSSVFNSLYVSTDWQHRLIMSAQICTAMFVAASIPDIPGKGWTVFATAYGVNRAITAYMYWRAARTGVEQSSLACRMARNFAILAAIFVPRAFCPHPWAICCSVSASWPFRSSTCGRKSARSTTTASSRGSDTSPNAWRFSS